MIQHAIVSECQKKREIWEEYEEGLVEWVVDSGNLVVSIEELQDRYKFCVFTVS